MPPATDSIARLQPALAFSRFLQRELGARPWLAPLLEDTLDQPLDRKSMQLFARQQAPDEERLKSGLRRLRSWVVCHTAARDLLGLATLDEVTSAMTMLAEVSLLWAHDLLHTGLASRHGQPIDREGRVLPLTVIGMGKLGGGELNVSSDIDLIFLYPEEGETKGDRPLDHFDFFGRLGRQLINALGEATGDGFVFRVDMRLRPFGESGPLALSYGGLEHYFITQGREWERYAWIKARPICGERLTDLQQIVRPFVFRKYLDFGAINNLRDLHSQIRAQVAQREMAMNVKLGPGGIREIEFIAQAMQLIRGGRDIMLQARPTLRVLDLLADRAILEPSTVAGLSAAYTFLRRLEHRLQYLDDAQTHDLPGSPATRSLIAKAMGFAEESLLLTQLDTHRRAVSSCFQHICGDPGSERHELIELWQTITTPESTRGELARLGFADPPAIAGRLEQLRAGSCYRTLPETIRSRFDRLLPQSIEWCARQANPDMTLIRTCNLLEAISRRGAYLALLQQHPQALQRVIELLAASSWAAEYLIIHPILLDELLDGRHLSEAPDWPRFAAALRQQLESAEPDTERQMDIMREQHHAQVFRLLHQDLAGKWQVEQIGDHLSALADTILEETIRQCWHKYGKSSACPPRFAVIGYGKLGGKELGYGSDLDIVFLYDDPQPEASEYYARLAQRILSWLTSRTTAGTLFATDTRLRPSGRSGPLVSHIEGFLKYQRESAWLWEHQALTRARFVAGNREVGDTFELAREDLLRLPRNLDELAEEIRAMRRRLLDNHPSRPDLFHLKEDTGGLIDFEFTIQYLVLGHAKAHPALVANLGNIALARIAGEHGLIDPACARAAADAYRTLRRLQHRQRLQNEEGWINPGEVETERQAISHLWRQVFGKPA